MDEPVHLTIDYVDQLSSSLGAFHPGYVRDAWSLFDQDASPRYLASDPTRRAGDLCLAKNNNDNNVVTNNKDNSENDIF